MVRRLSADLRPTQVPVLLGLRFVLSLSSNLPFFLRSDHRVRLDLSQLPSLAFPLSKSLCSLPALWTCCPDTEVKCQPASGPLSRWSLPGFCSRIRQGRAYPSPTSLLSLLQHLLRETFPHDPLTKGVLWVPSPIPLRCCMAFGPLFIPRVSCTGVCL